MFDLEMVIGQNKPGHDFSQNFLFCNFIFLQWTTQFQSLQTTIVNVSLADLQKHFPSSLSLELCHEVDWTTCVSYCNSFIFFIFLKFQSSNPMFPLVDMKQMKINRLNCLQSVKSVILVPNVLIYTGKKKPQVWSLLEREHD